MIVVSAFKISFPIRSAGACFDIVHFIESHVEIVLAYWITKPGIGRIGDSIGMVFAPVEVIGILL